MPPGNERRQFPRADVDWPVVIETAQRYVDGRTVDLSAGGAFICCREPIDQKEEFLMAIFDIPHLGRHLPISAEVVRSEIHCLDHDLLTHGIGVRFTQIADEDREFISTAVAGHSSA
jgi:hypothetical protein